MQHERHRHHHHHHQQQQHHHDQQQNKGYTHTVRVSFVLHRQDGAITQMPHNSIMIRGLNETQEKSILWITLFHWDVFFSHFEFWSRCEKEFSFFYCGHPIVPPDVDAKAHPSENSNKVLISLSSSSEHRLRCECGSENLLFMGTFLQSFKFISTFMPSEFKSATAIDLRTWYQLVPLSDKKIKKYQIKVFFFLDT